jgi:uncharacterized membrane protein YqjE
MNEPEGILSHLSALLAAKLAYFRARFQLAGLEGKEAAGHYAIIVALAIAALIVVIFGYLFLVIAVVFLIAALIDSPHAWMWVLLGAAGLHLFGALTLALMAKSMLAKPMFTATIDEFKKDQEWLKNPVNPN